MQNYVLSSNTKKGEIERAFPAYFILVFVNNILSINVVINLCRILWYSCTRYWVSYIIIHDNYCSKEIHEVMVFIRSGRRRHVFLAVQAGYSRTPDRL
jgi:hypothetical protein